MGESRGIGNFSLWTLVIQCSPCTDDRFLRDLVEDILNLVSSVF